MCVGPPELAEPYGSRAGRHCYRANSLSETVCRGAERWEHGELVFLFSSLLEPPEGNPPGEKEESMVGRLGHFVPREGWVTAIGCTG